MKALAVLLAVPTILIGILVFSLLLAWPFEIAWNYVIPTEFHLAPLSWTQAWALSFVSATLFKSSTVSNG